jgi:hypothetical protein
LAFSSLPQFLTMAQRYSGYFSDAPQHEYHRNAMAPPSLPLSHVTDIYGEQYHVDNFSQSGIPSSSDTFTTVHAQIWHSPAYPPSQNTFSATEGEDLAISHRQSGRHLPVPLDAKDSSGRTATISSAEWQRVKPIIKKLWLEKNNSLEETKTIMAEKHDFTASYVRPTMN